MDMRRPEWLPGAWARWAPYRVGAPAAARLVLVALLMSLPAQSAPPPRLSDAALAQIGALLREKSSRGSAERRIDSQLLYAIRAAEGRTPAPGVAALALEVEIDAGGRALVELRVDRDPGLEEAIRVRGGETIRHSRTAHALLARLPLDAIGAIAARPAVRFVAVPSAGMTQRAGGSMLESPAGDAQGARLLRFRERLAEALHGTPPGAVAKAGLRRSQGDATHRAIDARRRFGVDGRGVRIGVISDSFDAQRAAAGDVRAGELPGAGNPAGRFAPVRLAGSGDWDGGSDEGRAMLQIVHDLAPGAELYFATAAFGIADFANNIRALRGIAADGGAFGNVQPGCDIIVDDILYFAESGLHDGQSTPSDQNIALLGKAVADVVADGALFVSSATNSGNLTQGTAGVWEGDFAAGALPQVVPGGGQAHVFAGGDVGNTIGPAQGSTVTLHWSDPVGGSANDYDLFRLDAGLTTVLAASTNLQDGVQDPFERVTSGTGTRLVVVRRDGASPRFLSLSTNRGVLQYATTGQTRGHAAVPAAIGVAATPAAEAFGPPTPDGPFPGAFGAGNQIEPFSSDGPRRSFFGVDGGAYTPGNFLAATGGGVLRPKPDLTAADGVATALPPGGLNPFYGTSAAAPHLAAIGALLLQAEPAATPATLRARMAGNAVDIMAAGIDCDAGAGIVRAFEAVAATGIAEVAVLESDPPVIEREGGDGPILPGDRARIVVPLRNVGARPAGAASAMLVSLESCVVVETGGAFYGDIDAGQVVGNPLPFRVAVAQGCTCPQVALLRLAVTHTGGREAVSDVYVALPVAAAPLSLASTLDSVPATGLPAFLRAGSGSQNGNLQRNGNATTCTRGKSANLSDAQARRFDAYTLVSGATAEAYCVEVALTNDGAGSLQVAAYLDGFDPTRPAARFLGDPGNATGNAAGGSVRFAVSVPRERSLTLVVSDANANANVPIPYTLAVAGLCGNRARPLLVAGAPAVSGPDAAVMPNSCVTLAYRVDNIGTAPASGVQGVLSAPLGGVSVLPPAQASYPDLPPGAGALASTPFRVDAPASLACYAPLRFEQVLSHAGFAAASPLVFDTVVGRLAEVYTYAASNGATTPAPGAPLAGSVADDALVDVRVPDGFAFRAFDRSVAGGSILRASTNGTLQFTDRGGSTEYNNTALPSAAFGADTPVLLPFWDDLDTRVDGGGLYSILEGQAPERRWSLRWRAKRFRDTGNAVRVDFAVTFRENGREAEFRYLVLSSVAPDANGASATVGAQRADAPGRSSVFSVNQPLLAAPLSVALQLGSDVCRAGPGDCAAPGLFSDGFESAAPR